VPPISIRQGAEASMGFDSSNFLSFLSITPSL
jgi:hypothetical protein